QRFAELTGERARRAEERVERQHSPDVAMERVLGGEPDAAEDLLAMSGRGTRAPTRRCLGDDGVLGGTAGRRGVAVPRRGEYRLGGFDGHQRLGQAMADGLEHADWLAELDALECVLAGELEHRLGSADELVTDRELCQADG